MTDTAANFRPWPELAAEFRAIGWDATNAVADICDLIATRPISATLRGAKIGNVLAIERTTGAGRLEFQPTVRGSTQVRFADPSRPDNMWRRHEPPEKLLDRFRKAMLLIEWISDPASLD